MAEHRAFQEQAPEAPEAERVAYERAAFEQAVEEVQAHLSARANLCVLFAQADDRQRRDALAALAGEAANIFQIQVPSLIADRYVETMGNMRETFDRAEAEAALLFFDHADVLFDETEDAADTHETGAHETGTGEMTPTDYLFQRAAAFGGVVVIDARTEAAARQAERRGADLVVRF